MNPTTGNTTTDEAEELLFKSVQLRKAQQRIRTYAGSDWKKKEFFQQFGIDYVGD